MYDMRDDSVRVKPLLDIADFPDTVRAIGQCQHSSIAMHYPKVDACLSQIAMVHDPVDDGLVVNAIRPHPVCFIEYQVEEAGERICVAVYCPRAEYLLVPDLH
jgi:hypothetical protein